MDLSNCTAETPLPLVDLILIDSVGRALGSADVALSSAERLERAGVAVDVVGRLVSEARERVVAALGDLEWLRWRALGEAGEAPL